MAWILVLALIIVLAFLTLHGVMLGAVVGIAGAIILVVVCFFIFVLWILGQFR